MNIVENINALLEHIVTYIIWPLLILDVILERSWEARSVVGQMCCTHRFN